MNLRLLSLADLWSRARGYVNVQGGLAALTLILIVVFNQEVFQDRLLLNLYCIGIMASAYALVRRGAIAHMLFVLVVAAGTTLGNIYLNAGRDAANSFLDLTAWCVLLLLSWRLALRVYHIEREASLVKKQREIDEKVMAMRLSALAATSHEVRTPLAGILSFTEMLKDESAGPLSELQKNFIDEISQCGEHLMSLVNDILDYSKAQAGQIKLALEIVAVPELITQCVAMLHPRAKANDIKITTEIDPALSELVADPLRLKQILLNLLSNAVKYSPPCGLVRLQARAKGEEVLISVRDTGRGISANKLPHLFDPYYQVTQSDSQVGTGLGLGISKRLAEMHGGSITVESAPGSGSLFTLRLPATQPRYGRSDQQPTSEDAWWKTLMSESKLTRKPTPVSV